MGGLRSDSGGRTTKDIVLLGKGMHVMLLLFFSHEFVYTYARVSPKPCAQKKNMNSWFPRILYDLVEFVFFLFFWIVCGQNTACHSHL